MCNIFRNISWYIKRCITKYVRRYISIILQIALNYLKISRLAIFLKLVILFVLSLLWVIIFYGSISEKWHSLPNALTGLFCLNDWCLYVGLLLGYLVDWVVGWLANCLCVWIDGWLIRYVTCLLLACWHYDYFNSFRIYGTDHDRWYASVIRLSKS